MIDKQAATKIIRETFEKPFDKGQFTHFAKELLNFMDNSKTFVYQGNFIPDAYKQYVTTLERIGKYQDAEGNKIDVLVAQLKKETSLERARPMQRNFIAWYLNGSRGGEFKDAALVAFVSPDPADWRFSLVKMEYSREGTRIKTELTPARRYSFLVGENESSHTAQERLFRILQDDKNNPSLSELEKAFSVEVVTKEFFERYRGLYINLKEYVDRFIEGEPSQKIRREFEAKGIDTVVFCKKLLGQIVFLYFLQKKGWLGCKEKWDDGDKKFLRNLFIECQRNNRNFFNDYLEYLFYDALNNEHRGSADPSIYPRFGCKIPFLNGGLFNNDYDWQATDIKIGNELFSNKRGDNDEGSGVLDLFDLYNFTVKEDEPLDKEVAIDPEMLGKVFENLLEVKDRKSKGTYYTPREIVHYMCQESLINYLDNAVNTGEAPMRQAGSPQGKLLGERWSAQMALSTPAYQPVVPRQDIETLVRKGELAIEHDSRVESHGKETQRYPYKLDESIRQNAKLIDTKLENIRVCDPAVGSGAFLVGMMHEVVKCRKVLSTYLGEEEGRSVYDFKRHAIQSCLYGVDIDPGAVEIAKLRLWLSLVVDEEDIQQIKPLPNLDYKIVCGNSLLGYPYEPRGLEPIEKLKEQFFSEVRPKEKNQLRNQIDNAIYDLFKNTVKSLGYKVTIDFKVNFSEVFREKGGFDVVIANPPYLGEKGHKDIFREVRQGPLGKFYQGKMDIFYFFFHLSINLCKSNSQVAFISTNYYPTASGAKKLRSDFKKRTTIKHLINFNELKIFESALGQHNMITILAKAKDENAVAKNCITQQQGTATPEILRQILNGDDTETAYYKVPQKDLYDGDENYIRLTGSSKISDSPINVVLGKIVNQSIPITDLYDVKVGLRTGIDKISEKHLKIDAKFRLGESVFVLTNAELVNFSKLEKEKIIKPLFKNSDINRWYTSIQTDKFVIYSNKDTNIDLFPNIKSHLLKFKNLIEKIRKNDGEIWYSIVRPREVRIFVENKMVCPQRAKRNTFAYNAMPFYASSDVYYILNKESENHFNLKYLLALLNSKLYYFWLYHRGKRKGETLELYQKPLSEIPVKKISEREQQPFITIVDRILAITKDDDYLTNPAKQARVRELEREIDQMVYQLYGLTPEEIAVVEGSIRDKA